MNPFKYGETVDGENFCRRPELARILKGYVESGQNVVMQGERRMGKTSLVLETVPPDFSKRSFRPSRV